MEAYAPPRQLDDEGDVPNIIFFLRSGLMRSLGNLTDARLFARFRTGGKAAAHEHQRLVAALFQVGRLDFEATFFNT